MPSNTLLDGPPAPPVDASVAATPPSEALIKTGALQDAIFNSVYFSSIATDEKGVIQIFNVGAERMLGYSAAEIINCITPADISDPDEILTRATSLSQEYGTPISPGFEALVFKASRGIEDIYELTYVRKDGSRFPAIVSVTVLRDAADTILGYLLIGTDNTARKQVEAAQALLDQRLRDQQFYTRSLIESNVDALMMTDPQGIISDVNQQMVALTGRTRDELIGAPSKKFFTDQTQADAAIKRVLKENKVTDYELTVRALNGVETVVSYNAATFHDRDRKLQGVFAAARDVTERKRFEQALHEKNIELEHASRMKSEFLATMSHELRTPLNAIIGFSEALKDGLVGPMSENQQEYMGDIFGSGQHLLSLINDILDLSKVEAGMMELDLDEVDLVGLLSNSLAIVKEKAMAQRIALVLDIDDTLGVPQLDVRKTKQIVYNLLSNAVKFSPRGASVTLQARHVARSAVGRIDGNWPVFGFALADNEFTDFLELVVSDSGIGISEAGMVTLFQAFRQIDSSLARKFEGTGLGLAMVKKLAEIHGGAVAVASCVGHGSRFAVWLPLRGVQSAFTPVPEQADPVPIAYLALVIADDERGALMIRQLLETEGFAVIVARDIEQAVALGTIHRFDLITFDLLTPDDSGAAFLGHISDGGILAEVPVVVVAALVDGSIGLQRGAAAVLQKPVGITQLRLSLASLGLRPIEGLVHTVLVVDDDPLAVEVIAACLPAPAYAVVRAYGGREAIALASRLQPDLVLLDLMMPEVSGFDVVRVLHEQAATSTIPIVVITARPISTADRALLCTGPDGVGIVASSGLNKSRFLSEVRRAMRPH